MKSFKNFISEGDVILFPGKQPKPEQKPIPQYSEPEIPLDQIKAHAKSVGEEVFSTLKANGRKFETPTLTSAYGTDRRPDFFTQLNDHIFGEGGNREFAEEYYRNNKKAIDDSIEHSIRGINEIEGRNLPATTGRTHEAMVKRETGLPIFQLERLKEKLRGLDE